MTTTREDDSTRIIDSRVPFTATRVAPPPANDSDSDDLYAPHSSAECGAADEADEAKIAPLPVAPVSWYTTFHDLLLGGGRYLAPLQQHCSLVRHGREATAAAAVECSPDAASRAELWTQAEHVLCARFTAVLSCDFARSSVLTGLLDGSPGEAESAAVAAPDFTATIAANLTRLWAAAQQGSSTAQQEQQQLLGTRLLLLAVAALNAYVQSNWTGPPLTATPLSITSTEYAAAYAAQATAALRLHGEDVYEAAAHPELLQLARVLLTLDGGVSPLRLLLRSRGETWAALRCVLVHQALLDVNAQALKAQADVLLPTLIAAFRCPAALDDEATAAAQRGAEPPLAQQLECAVLLECARGSHLCWKWAQEAACLERATAVSGLLVELTGVMGYRTKWQKDKKSQLVLRANRAADVATGRLSAAAAAAPEAKLSAEERQQVERDAHEQKQKESAAEQLRAGAEAVAPRANSSCAPVLDVDESGDLFSRASLMPVSAQMQSDVLLAEPALDRVEVSSALSALQRALLLALCDQLRHTSAAHLSTDSEMLAFVVRVLRLAPHTQRSWAIESYALYVRSLLEVGDNHKTDRAIQQLEDLTKFLHTSTVESAYGPKPTPSADLAAVRLVDVYATAYPPLWELKSRIGAQFQKLGLHLVAMTLYESAHLWDGLIETCIALGRKARAEELIRQRLAAPTPSLPLAKLHCLLGDVLDDPVHYREAWTVSEHAYPRAQRSLAKWHRERQEHAAACDAYQLALAINPAFPGEWFALGFCAIELRRFELAIIAYNRVTALDPEYGDAWNNLAAAHLHLDHQRPAFRALQHATRLLYENWRVWENYRDTALVLREWQPAMHAMERLVKLRPRDQDVQGLRLLAAAVEREAGEHRAREGQKPFAAAATGASVPSVPVQPTMTGSAASAVTPLYAENDDVQLAGETGRSETNELDAASTAILSAASARLDNFLVARFEKLLRSLTATVTTSALVWACWARVRGAAGDRNGELEFMEKAVRCVEQQHNASGEWLPVPDRAAVAASAGSNSSDAAASSAGSGARIAASSKVNSATGTGSSNVYGESGSDKFALPALESLGLMQRLGELYLSAPSAAQLYTGKLQLTRLLERVNKSGVVRSTPSGSDVSPAEAEIAAAVQRLTQVQKQLDTAHTAALAAKSAGTNGANAASAVTAAPVAAAATGRVTSGSSYLDMWR